MEIIGLNDNEANNSEDYARDEKVIVV